MRSTSERTAAIEKRTVELRRSQREKKGLVISGLSVLVCLAVIAAAALTIPAGIARQSSMDMGSFSGAAGVFASDGAGGYVLIGFLAFVLGCCVTIFCYRIRRQDQEKTDDRDRR